MRGQLTHWHVVVLDLLLLLLLLSIIAILGGQGVSCRSPAFLVGPMSFVELVLDALVRPRYQDLTGKQGRLPNSDLKKNLGCDID